MIVLKALDTSYSQDPIRYLHFERFKNITDKVVLLEGIFSKKSNFYDFGATANTLKNKKVIRIELEEPNKYLVNDKVYEYDKLFSKIYTICPYSAEWINDMQKKNKRVAIFFPFNEDFIPKPVRKKYDIIYTGHILCNKLREDIKSIGKFNYRLVSNSNDPLVTNKGVSYIEKLKLISQSKITLVHNLLYLNRFYVLNLWRIPHFKKNKAFKDIPSKFNLLSLILKRDFFAPQIKSRTFEAAFCRSLILCRKDNFNVIENFFVPNKDFIYYEEGQLEETIKDILSDYSSYKKLIDNAYKKAVKYYTTQAFVNKYLVKFNQ